MLRYKSSCKTALYIAHSLSLFQILVLEEHLGAAHFLIAAINPIMARITTQTKKQTTHDAFLAQQEQRHEQHHAFV